MSKHKDRQRAPYYFQGACKVRVSSWEDGRLTVNDEYFQEMDDAVEFAEKQVNAQASHECKVYHVDGSVASHHKRKGVPSESYA